MFISWIGIECDEGIGRRREMYASSFWEVDQNFFVFLSSQCYFRYTLTECGAYVDGDYYLFQVGRRVGVKKK
jgi:hypothetical protein